MARLVFTKYRQFYVFKICLYKKNKQAIATTTTTEFMTNYSEDLFHLNDYYFVFRRS